MSERFPGMPPPPPPTQPRPAAVVVLYRRTPFGVEVFWVKRERALAFAGGFYAFPGGKVDPADAAVPVAGAVGEEAALRVAAARELFEEAGVLLATGAKELTASRLALLRRALLDGERSFGELLAAEGLSLRAEDLRPAGRWITPAFSPLRFDAHFFLVELPAGAQAEAWAGELAEGAWVVPADALLRWRLGTALLHPPNLHALQVLSTFTSEPDVRARLATPNHCPAFIAQRLEYQQGLRVMPLETDTLPPATHTNAYVLGNGQLLIVDPGASDVRQYAKLLSLVAGLKDEGKRPLAVLLTHHHADHIGGARAVKERLGLPVWCHARTADRLPFAADRLLQDGEVLTLEGDPVQHWRVLHTPGHAQGHLCFVEERTRAAVVGDMVAGVGTIVIDPPEGDMAHYLQQLVRLRDLPVGTLYASHGPPIPDGPRKLEEYLAHRRAREERILEALPEEGSGLTLDEVVARAYADTPPFLHPVAERSALASLEKLQKEGRARCADERWARGAGGG